MRAVVLAVVLALVLGSQALGEQTTTGEAKFLTQIRQLTLEGRRSGEGYFSADGKALVFQSERELDNPSNHRLKRVCVL